MLPPGTSTQLIGTTYLPSLPPKEISYICRHLQAYPQEPTVPRNQNNLKAARSSSESQKRQVIWNSLQSCSAAHKLQNSTTRKVRILYIFWRMVRVRRAFCASAVVVFFTALVKVLAECHLPGRMYDYVCQRGRRGGR